MSWIKQLVVGLMVLGLLVCLGCGKGAQNAGGAGNAASNAESMNNTATPGNTGG